MIFDISNQPAPLEPDPLAAVKLRSLLGADTPEDPLHFHSDLALEEVHVAHWFRLARGLLLKLAGLGSGPSEPLPTLPPAALIEPADSGSELACLLGGLVEGGLAGTAESGGLALTPKGRALLSAQRAGELYRCLFEYLCRQPARRDLQDAGPQGEVLAHLLGPILISLGTRLQQWIRVDEVPAAVLPPVLWEQLGRTRASREKWVELLTTAILNRLMQLGLLETDGGSTPRSLSPGHCIRRTPLWMRFMEIRSP